MVLYKSKNEKYEASRNEIFECGKCGTMKPGWRFYRSSSRSTGRQAHCKECCQSRLSSRERTAKPRAEAMQTYLANALNEYVCPGCGIERRGDEFGFSRWRSTCRAYRCKSCERKRLERRKELF